MWAVILLILCMSQVRASDQVFAGLYEVDVSLELPHVLDAAPRKTTTLCLNEDEGTAFGLAVLSDNNPLANCPVSAILRQGNAVSFDIICPGVSLRKTCCLPARTDQFRGPYRDEDGRQKYDDDGGAVWATHRRLSPRATTLIDPPDRRAVTAGCYSHCELTRVTADFDLISLSIRPRRHAQRTTDQRGPALRLS